MVKCTKSQKCLVGKTAIITGANSGIGFETAVELASRGCRVIMACRNMDKAEKARKKLIDSTTNENVVTKLLDLESFTSVREFVEDISKNESRLDLLVNNAGAYVYHEKLTADSLQLKMVVNYFSPFLLTNLLLDLLKKSAPSRIINVSSVAGKLLNLKFDELNSYDGELKTYARSKLCNILFTRELAKRLVGSGVTTYSLHPGIVNTDIYTIPNGFLEWVKTQYAKSSKEGAQTSIYLCLEEDIEKYNGRHFVDCEVVGNYNSARDMDKARKLWEISSKSVGLVE